ncbi:MAG: PIN domain-containing protein [Deltaproteobacteria bacterium]|nr:PIN domain-containing protein [Deltaproteobacteria bacterium]
MQKVKILPDSNCFVAAVCAWHEHHAATVAALAVEAKAGHGIVIAAPALVEAYAVLTRLPQPHRLALADAHHLLEGNWGRNEIVGLSAKEYWQFLARCRDEGIGGGMTYDALIAACARKSAADVLLTWNVAHFVRFRGDFDVRAPAA